MRNANKTEVLLALLTGDITFGLRRLSTYNRLQVTDFGLMTRKDFINPLFLTKVLRVFSIYPCSNSFD
jgi:hypothetical protein